VAHWRARSKKGPAVRRTGLTFVGATRTALPGRAAMYGGTQTPSRPRARRSHWERTTWPRGTDRTLARGGPERRSGAGVERRRDTWCDLRAHPSTGERLSGARAGRSVGAGRAGRWWAPMSATVVAKGQFLPQPPARQTPERRGWTSDEIEVPLTAYLELLHHKLDGDDLMKRDVTRDLEERSCRAGRWARSSTSSRTSARWWRARRRSRPGLSNGSELKVSDRCHRARLLASRRDPSE